MSDASRTNRQGQTAVQDRENTQPPRMYRVVLHNDHYTPMEFVVVVLTSIFHKPQDEAVHLMLTVHHKGRATVARYGREVAEQKVEETTELARTAGHPLRVTMEAD
jgi:ATP-dependent Clp protease adaptor protein ClpS